MRALRVVGLHEDGKSIVCEDPASRTRFLLPADERLRAAARGDITRLGQIEIELESQMRPREIQARIRAGESVEQVASSAGVSVQRVERFAYPVLLERSRTAELAQRAHPIREDGPDVQTLGEVMAHSFGLRGHDYSQATWDSWRGDDGKWVVVLSWKAGRSDNRAHWSFSPGAHGGTVQALDENAEVLLNPNAYRAPRTVRALDPGRDAIIQPTLDSAPEEPVAKVIDAPIAEPEEDVESPLPADEPEEVAEPAPRAKGKKNHPIVPSWEDVLLGVRSQRG
ncbi:septation protein SepH [Amycolatopsis regifaucium]|uniref:DNA-binding protein n=1 Tax=Amycolatopsis regifaucium TaxID=546365 RepID=A0A154MSP8_9PSEU|nr:septation protein SepH [Amycolatopsis regifaucium]KZB87282.1 DNA-binding protein [Amycolatopsis regifaucium]OKA08116.1 DNA-binding protein [Amycolatopsis regifaucium]SFI40155.1 Protein of unknown function [Amycolatopsis regifaucium]